MTGTPGQLSQQVFRQLLMRRQRDSGQDAVDIRDHGTNCQAMACKQ
jgi:hypothetical protein